MKRLLVIVLALLMGLAALPALAELYDENGDLIWCTPEDVDLSLVREENGRLVGEILIPESDGQPHVLKIDCPVPQAFTEEQQVKLHVSYRNITKKDLAEAMKALGQKISTDHMGQYRSGWATRCLWYRAGGGERNGAGFSYPRVMPGYQNQDRPNEIAQAMEHLKKLAEALNLPLDGSSLSAARNVPEDFLRFYSPSQYSSEWYENQYQRLTNLLDREDITLLEAGYQLYGLPVMRQFAWKEKNEVFGETSAMECIFRDDGTLLDLSIYSVPDVESSESITLPDTDWQELLRQLVSQCYWPNQTTVDALITDSLHPEPYTVFAGYDVITSIQPCWIGQEKQTLEPGWNMTYVRYIMKDDSISGFCEKSMTAAELKKAY